MQLSNHPTAHAGHVCRFKREFKRKDRCRNEEGCKRSWRREKCAQHPKISGRSA